MLPLRFAIRMVRASTRARRIHGHVAEGHGIGLRFSTLEDIGTPRRPRHHQDKLHRCSRMAQPICSANDGSSTISTASETPVSGTPGIQTRLVIGTEEEITT